MLFNKDTWSIKMKRRLCRDISLIFWWLIKLYNFQPCSAQSLPSKTGMFMVYWGQNITRKQQNTSNKMASREFNNYILLLSTCQLWNSLVAFVFSVSCLPKASPFYWELCFCNWFIMFTILCTHQTHFLGHL